MAAKGRVLIIDDEPDIVGLIRNLLENDGYEVIEAYRGEEGLIKATQENPDIVLIDIKLPDIDGNKLLKRIKETNPKQSVIMITAYADVDNAITSLKFGADDFIRKPFDNVHLIHIVNKSFERRQIEREREYLKSKYDKLVKGKDMSKKDKLVLYSLTKYSVLSDKEISERIGIPRTTLTGIKNKLKGRGMYKRVNIPNFPALGFELISVIAGELNPSVSYHIDIERESEILRKEEVVYAQITDLEGLLICISNNYTEYKRDIEPNLNELIYNNYFKRLYVYHFPLRISRIIRFMDFSPLLYKLFEIEGEFDIDECFMSDTEQKRISKTEKNVINALVGNPEFSDAEIADKVSLSRARVSQIKKRLTEERIIKSAIFPDLKNIGGNIISIISGVLNPKCTSEGMKNLIDTMKSEATSIFSVLSNTEFLSIHVLEDYDNYKDTYNKIEMAGKENGCITKELKTILLPVEKVKSERIDFHSILELKM